MSTQLLRCARNLAALASLFSFHANAALPPKGSDTQQYALAHVQQHRLDANERAPQTDPETLREIARSDYDQPQDIAARLQQLRPHTTQYRMQKTAAACDISVFANSSGNALVTAIKAVDVTCLNQLYSITGAAAGQTFIEAKMVNVANAIFADAPTYPGTDNNKMLELITFLRAGYYVQYYDTVDVGNYGTALANAIRPALDAFTVNAHFQDVNDNHGQILSEFVTLIDSAAENAHQLNTVAGILNRYGPSYNASYYMRSAVNNVFNVLFRGHQNADFQTLVQSDSSITTVLAAFISNNTTQVGTVYEYLLANAGLELARFLQYPDPLHSTLHPKVKAVLDAYSLGGNGASIYMSTAGNAYAFDEAHCSYFNLCNFPQAVEQTILTVSYQCSPTLKLRAQTLTPDQVAQTCSIVGNEEGYFHQKLATNHQPVANDNNSMLEMVVFSSSTDYQTYSGVIFGNNTNNGGIYLEGDPSVVGNQPRFLCYVAEWLTPFEIWNLTHEYIHYNDGRFDMHGNFGDYPLDLPGSSVWYIEGLAEYLSYSYREVLNPNAISDAATHGFSLSQVFDNTYDSGQVLVYHWGYLATRFMFENHRDQITTMLGYFRPGNYAAYRTFLAGIQTSHDSEWNTWLTCLASHNGDTTTCGGTGNSETGIFRGNFDGDALPPPKECTDADTQHLGDNCTRSNISASNNNPAYFTVLLPAGLSSLEIQTSGGTGNADLYAKLGNWPSSTDYDGKSTQAGNSESMTIANPAAGWCYIMLPPTQSFSGVQILTLFHH